MNATPEGHCRYAFQYRLSRRDKFSTGLGSASNFMLMQVLIQNYSVGGGGGGGLRGWLPILYHTEPLGWLASNDRLIPIVSCINKQVKGGRLATPSTPLDQPL